ncbi:MAG: hypothetical protein HGB32_14625 [Geobacteraceae bacterium]|nr:hypothetical protein [Geobacteraceae bacterium]NTW81360.1 hypothetical protein [Geobacteraceae bacterium]
MVKISVNSIIFLLISAITFSNTAQSATIYENKETANKLDTSNERNPIQYHLVTLPSTNKKRVDAMCFRFLSIIPKAMLTPKTEESTVYRLIANTFDTIEAAKKRKAELLRHCESPFVMKSDHGYSVIAGSQLTETLAVAEQKRLAGKKISTTILQLRLPLKRWQMKSSESFNIRNAVIMASKLAKIGVVTTIEPTAY